jgi:hypothetical protein
MMSPEETTRNPNSDPVDRSGPGGGDGLVAFASLLILSGDIDIVGIGEAWTNRVPHSLQNKVPTNS